MVTTAPERDTQPMVGSGRRLKKNKPLDAMACDDDCQRMDRAAGPAITNTNSGVAVDFTVVHAR